LLVSRAWSTRSALSWLCGRHRECTFVYYSAADNHVRGLLAQALHHADHLDRDLPPGEHAQPHHPRAD
jgi:hypothetical protein